VAQPAQLRPQQLDVQRVYPGEETNTAATTLIRRLVRRLPVEGPVPTFVFDAGYDPLQLALDLAGTRATILVRLRRDRCFYADPPPTPRRPQGGRPRRHGAKFACSDATTWPTPSLEHREEDEQYGAVRVRAWGGLHAKPQTHPGNGSYLERPVVRGTVVLVEVSRLPGHSRRPPALWLWWSGPGEPDLALLWRAYVRRFDQEHTFRLLKGALNWTVPRFRHPVQADRWTWLVLLAYTYLRLARPLVADRRLPWERPLRPGQLTPYRVRRAVSPLLLCLATPASPPKPCGLSPGRPQGARSGPARRWPLPPGHHDRARGQTPWLANHGLIWVRWMSERALLHLAHPGRARATRPEPHARRVHAVGLAPLHPWVLPAASVVAGD
jgi:hypothetical protein